MAFISSEVNNEIVTITLTAGVTNPINLELINALSNELDDNSSDNNLSGLILTSANNKFFSIGFDIPALLTLSRTGIEEFYTAFNDLCLRLFTLQIPTISTITGHYVAAGCILAACTDYRFLGNINAKTGITAIKLGLPVPFLSEQIVRLRFNESQGNELLATGDLYSHDWVKDSGFIDQFTSQEELLTVATDFIRNKYISDNFKHLKKEKVMPIVEAYKNNKEQDKQNFIAKWFSEPVQVALKEATKKF
jgi:enoyl-CoA hydratase/carnithine racemase